MRGSLKKIEILFVLFSLFGGYLNAQNKDQKSLYAYFDKWKKNEDKFKFIQINLLVDCKNQLLFTASKKDLIYYDEKKEKEYKTYSYKGMLIIYEIDDKIINRKNILFFDKYLESINYDVKSLPRGNQSLINTYILYFKDNKLITNDKKIHYFMENNCKSSE